MRHRLPVLGLLLATLGLGLVVESSPAGAATQRLTYRVQHSRYGTIGTYTNAIDTNGSATTVKTEAHIKVGLLGVTFYRQDVDRQERWDAGRLVGFHGVTTVNGHAYELNGAADGDRFVMNSPEGPIVAPASVKLANPWSPEVLRGDTLLTPDRARVENVQIKGGEETSVAIDGRQTRAKRYEIDRLDGTKRYEVWIDGRGTPVMFTTYNPNGSITFTLTG